MRLRSYPVILVLDGGTREIAECFLCRGRRTCQHEANRMEQPHLRFSELPRGCEPQSLADVTQQHVGPLYLRQCPAEGFGDGLFDQALLQSDPQIASYDLDEVLGFPWRSHSEQVAQQGRLCRWPTRLGDLAKFLLHLKYI